MVNSKELLSYFSRPPDFCTPLFVMPRFVKHSYVLFNKTRLLFFQTRGDKGKNFMWSGVKERADGTAWFGGTQDSVRFQAQIFQSLELIVY